MNDSSHVHVVKLGGSLLGLPDLGMRLCDFLAACSGNIALLVGGGAAADIVRKWDATHNVGEAEGHWLAVRAMQFNAHLVRSLLDEHLVMVRDPGGCHDAWLRGRWALIEPVAWLKREHDRGIRIPHRWSFTSDSIAAHVAARINAQSLRLLKSTLPQGECDVQRAADGGIVDEDFPGAASRLACVELVNLRLDPPGRCVLKG